MYVKPATMLEGVSSVLLPPKVTFADCCVCRFQLMVAASVSVACAKPCCLLHTLVVSSSATLALRMEPQVTAELRLKLGVLLAVSVANVVQAAPSTSRACSNRVLPAPVPVRRAAPLGNCKLPESSHSSEEASSVCPPVPLE